MSSTCTEVSVHPFFVGFLFNSDHTSTIKQALHLNLVCRPQGGPTSPLAPRGGLCMQCSKFNGVHLNTPKTALLTNFTQEYDWVKPTLWCAKRSRLGKEGPTFWPCLLISLNLYFFGWQRGQSLPCSASSASARFKEDHTRENTCLLFEHRVALLWI